MLEDKFKLSGVNMKTRYLIMRKLALVSIVMFIAFIYGCSAASKAVKQGDELLAMKNYYGATQEYLNALKLEPDHQDAKMKLCQTSNLAYEQKLAMAENFEKSSDFESALKHYRELSTFIDKLSSYNCLNFPAINTKQKIEEMQSSASEKYYREAESLFASENYNSAIPKYTEALKHNKPYKDCTEKIAESYYRIASKLENQNSFRDAAKNYMNANTTVEGYKDAASKATNLYYSLGEYFLSKELCRNAWNDFNEASKINPGFKDVSEKMSKADACAVTKIAFVRFDNPTGRNIAGMSMGDFIFDDIKSQLQKKASRFIRILDRDELETIFSEQKLGISGITDEYATFKRLKGVHYLIFGKLSQVNSVHQSPKEENMKTTGTRYYDCIKTDRKGKQYNSTCSTEIPVNFTKISDKISVSLSGSIKVVGVATGEQLIFHNISANRSDSIEYANITSDVSSVEIPSFLKDLVNARKELKDEDSLAKEMVFGIASEMVRKILDKIDRAQAVTDPVEMKVFK